MYSLIYTTLYVKYITWSWEEKETHNKLHMPQENILVCYINKY